MNRLFKVMPQHLNRIQVRTLTRPLQSLHFVFLQPFRGGFAGVFWIIVLLQNPNSLQLEVTNRWPDIVHQDFLVDSRIHGSIYHSKSSRSWSSKTAPDHHTTTTIFTFMHLADAFIQSDLHCIQVTVLHFISSVGMMFFFWNAVLLLRQM